MDLGEWQIDLDRSLAIHHTGFRLTVEGDPRKPTGVLPGVFPDGLSAAEQAALLRCGLNALIHQAKSEAKETETKSRKKIVHYLWGTRYETS